MTRKRPASDWYKLDCLTPVQIDEIVRRIKAEVEGK
jgi:hypothetical protein